MQNPAGVVQKPLQNTAKLCIENQKKLQLTSQLPKKQPQRHRHFQKRRMRVRKIKVFAVKINAP